MTSLATFIGTAGLATVASATIQEGAQGLRLSRMSLPFLAGTFFSGQRSNAMVIGFVLYLSAGLLIAGLYRLAFVATGLFTWWAGLCVGVLHGVFILVAVLPILPHVHPRMASEHMGPVGAHGIEPPGFLALNYGYATPLITIFAQAVYGTILGALSCP